MFGHAIPVPHTADATTLDACRSLCSTDASCAAFHVNAELAAEAAVLKAKYDGHLPTLVVGGAQPCALRSKLGAVATGKAHHKTFLWHTKQAPSAAASSVTCAYAPTLQDTVGAYAKGAGLLGARVKFGVGATNQACADLCPLPPNAESCAAFSFSPTRRVHHAN